MDELIQYYREYNHAHHEDYVTIYPYVEEMLKYLKATRLSSSCSYNKI